MGARDTVHFSVRLPRSLARGLADLAAEQGSTVSGTAIRLLEEAVRMARHPGIDFRATPAGRRAFVTGTGLSVWEACWIWNAHDRDARSVRKNYPHLTSAQLAAAVRYAESFPAEIARDLRHAQPARSRVPFAKTVRV